MKTEEEQQQQQQIENEVVEEQENDIKPVVEHSVKVCHTLSTLLNLILLLQVCLSCQVRYCDAHVTCTLRVDSFVKH